MILVVSLAAESPSLHDMEFVRPITREVGRVGSAIREIHHTDLTAAVLEEADGVILCGTALGDNQVLEETDRFNWLRTCTKPVLGICVGANLICKVHGGQLEENVEIGHVPVEMTVEEEDPVIGELGKTEVYGLHTLAPILPDAFRALARSGDTGTGDPHWQSRGCVQAFVRKDSSVYGILFHSEVRHRGIIHGFCRLSCDNIEI
jgi:GMP synthase-like glutamine amidotransferase